MSLKHENSDVKQQYTLHKKLNFLGAEAYKLLRANLMFAMADGSEKKCHIIGVTSSVRNEGKSTTSVNLSYTIAETGKKVLLIDADLRLPTIAKKMKVDNKPGLTNLLANPDIEADKVFHSSSAFNRWTILPAGSIPPNPSELLGSQRMKNLMANLSEDYDYIVVDLPPVNIVSDALTVSNLLDGMVVVVRENFTDRKSLNECVSKLEMFKVKVFGFVLNGAKEQNKVYKHGKKYYKYYK